MTITNMEQQTQKEWALDMLKKTGECTRNGALQRRITRLGAIMNELKHEGYDIEGYYRYENGGKDYVYILKSKKEDNDFITYTT